MRIPATTATAHPNATRPTDHQAALVPDAAVATASPAATVNPPTGSIRAPSRLHGMTSASLATSNRAAMIRITGQAMVQRQPQATAITAFSGGPRIDGSSQITAYIASTRGRSASLYSPPMAVSPNAASSPAASPRSTLPASTQDIVGASAEQQHAGDEDGGGHQQGQFRAERRRPARPDREDNDRRERAGRQGRAVQTGAVQIGRGQGQHGRIGDALGGGGELREQQADEQPTPPAGEDRPERGLRILGIHRSATLHGAHDRLGRAG